MGIYPVSSNFDIHNVQSIHAFFQPILGSAQQDIQTVALSALASLNTHIQESTSLSLSSTQAISQHVEELKILAVNNPLITDSANRILALVRSSPCFIFDPTEYIKNNTLPPDYLEKTQKDIIEYIKNAIKSALQTETLSKCLPQLIPYLGAKRGEIAAMQGTEDAHCFGQLRFEINSELFTPVSYDGPYKEYGKQFLDSFAHLFRINKKELHETGSCLRGPTVHGFISRFIYRIGSKEDLLNRCLKETMTLEDTLILNDLFAAFDDPIEELQSASKILIYANMDLEKNSTHYPLSQYFIFMDKSKLENSPINFDNDDILTILHQSPKFSESTTEELNTLFIRCVHSQTQQELKENVALFRYLFAHAGPYSRGSAMVGELLEKAIYQYHNYNVHYGIESSTRRSLADLDAILTFTLQDYMQIYLSKVSLERTNSS